jgi:hypothetical protein
MASIAKSYIETIVIPIKRGITRPCPIKLSALNAKNTKRPIKSPDKGIIYVIHLPNLSL